MNKIKSFINNHKPKSICYIFLRIVKYKNKMGRNNTTSYTQASQNDKKCLNNFSSVESSIVLSEENGRENWSNKAEYLLALVGNAVGIGNIWRFPFQCKLYGGGKLFI